MVYDWYFIQMPPGKHFPALEGLFLLVTRACWTPTSDAKVEKKTNP
jgi:hypothetical protein